MLCFAHLEEHLSPFLQGCVVHCTRWRELVCEWIRRGVCCYPCTDQHKKRGKKTAVVRKPNKNTEITQQWNVTWISEVCIDIWTRCWFQIFVIITPEIEEIIQFDEHIFQGGWVNHQLDEWNVIGRVHSTDGLYLDGGFYVVWMFTSLKDNDPIWQTSFFDRWFRSTRKESCVL